MALQQNKLEEAWKWYQRFATAPAVVRGIKERQRRLHLLQQIAPNDTKTLALPQVVGYLAAVIGLPVKQSVMKGLKKNSTLVRLQQIANSRKVPLRYVLLEQIWAALPLALAEADKWQKVRINRKYFYLVDEVGERLFRRPSELIPRSHLDPKHWDAWLVAEIHRQIALSVLDDRSNSNSGCDLQDLSETAQGLELFDPKNSAAKALLKKGTELQQRIASEYLVLLHERHLENLAKNTILKKRQKQRNIYKRGLLTLVANRLGLSPSRVRVEWCRFKARTR